MVGRSNSLHMTGDRWYNLLQRSHIACINKRGIRIHSYLNTNKSILSQKREIYERDDPIYLRKLHWCINKKDTRSFYFLMDVKRMPSIVDKGYLQNCYLSGSFVKFLELLE